MKKLLFVLLTIVSVTNIGYSQNVGVWNNTDGSLRLGTTTLEIIHINTDGNVGIGESVPMRQLHVAGAVRLTPLGTPPATPEMGDMYIDGTGQLYVFNGSTWDNLSAAASNTIWQSAGGNVSLFNDADNVGIGVTGPNSKLEVAGDIRLPNGQLIFSANDNVRIYGSTSEYFAFYTNNIEHLRIDATGNIGAGTPSPTGAFNIHRTTGSSQLYISTDVNLGSGNEAAIWFESDRDGTPNQAGIGMFGDGALRFTGASNLVNPDMIIDESGKVGIGINAPTRKLSIQGDNAFEIFESGGSRKMLIDVTPTTAKILTSNAAELILGTAGAEQMRIDGTGKLGIGTSTPTAKLDVFGTFKLTDGTQGLNKVLTSDASGNATWQVASVSSPAGANGEVQFNNSGSFGGASNLYYNAGTGNVGVGTTSAGQKLTVEGNLKFNTGDGIGLAVEIQSGIAGNTKVPASIRFEHGPTWGDDGNIIFKTDVGGGMGTERMRINHVGSVGIGTNTPTQLFSVAEKFQVNSSGNIVKLNNVPTSFPAANAAGVLTNNGTGILTWAPAGGPPSGPAGGSLSGTYPNPDIAAGVIGTGEITDNTVGNVDLGAGVGGIYKGSGSLSGATTVTQGANTLAFTSTAVNGFSVDGTTFSVDAANNRVGIGTASPSEMLHVSNSAGNANIVFNAPTGAYPQLFFKENNANGWHIAQEPTTKKFTVTESGIADRMVFIPGGNVGIGTTTPAAKLDITGDGGTILIPRKSTAGDPAGGANGMIYYNSTTNKFRAYENGLWIDMVIGAGSSAWSRTAPYTYLTNGTDNVGIGTTTPNNKLDISVGAGFTASALNIQNTNSSNGNSIFAISTNGSGAGINISQTGFGSAGVFNISNGTSSSHSLSVTTNGGNSRAGNFSHTGASNSTTDYGIYATSTGGGTNTTNVGGYFSATGATNNYAAIFEQGNVGIGTTSPGTLLHINKPTGGEILRITGQTSGDPYIKIQSNATDVVFGANNSGTGAGEGFVGSHNATPFFIRTSNINRVFIQPGGNVGIGASSPSAFLDVENDGGTIRIPRKSTTGDPAGGINGMIYYNELDGKFRVYENGAWKDWITPGSNPGWELTGNVGTNPATDFLGPTDDVPFSIKINGLLAGRIESDSYNENTTLGFKAGSSTSTGIRNTAVGLEALLVNTSGNNNVSMGFQSLYANTMGSGNTAIGSDAGTGLNPVTTGNNNTFLGANTGLGSATQRVNATAIGYNAKVDADNAMVLGGTGADAVSVGIGTTTPTEKLQIVNSVAAGDGVSASLIAGTTGTSAFYMGNSGNNYLGAIRYNNSTNTLDFWTNNTPNRIKIDGSGNVAIPTLVGPGTVQVDASGNLSVASGGTVTGSGAVNFIPKWTSTTNLGVSSIDDNGARVAINTFLSVGAGSPPTNQKIYAEQGAATGRAGRFEILNSSNPDEALFVTTNGTGKALSVSNTNASTGTKYGIYSTAVSAVASTAVAGYFSSTGGGTNYAAIFENGNVGIGTVDPAHKLEINSSTNPVSGSNLTIGNIPLKINNSNGANGDGTGIRFAVSTAVGNTGGGAIVFERTGANSQGKMHFSTKSSTTADATIPIRMTLDQNGNVGIGRVDPPNRLSVSGVNSIVESTVAIESFNSSTTVPPVITFRKSPSNAIGTFAPVVANESLGIVRAYGGNSTSSAYIESALIAFQADAAPTASNLPGRIIFQTDDGTSLATRMTISSSGNVGIGTTAPSFKLQSITTTAGDRALHGENTFGGGTDGYGVYGRSVNAAGFGFGGYFEGGYRGVEALGNSTAATSTFGVLGRATGSGGSRFGVYGQATTANTANNYGLYGEAQNGSGNYGLWINNGETKVTDALGVVPTRTANGSIATSNNGGTRFWFRTNNTNYFINSSGAGDYSEYFKTADTTLAVGEIVSLSSIKDNAVQRANSKEQMLLGVVSKYGTRNNDDQEGQRMYDKNSINIALLGQLQVKVSVENGNIAPGDPLTLSEKYPGVAVKAITDGKIIGYAMTHYPYVKGEEHYPVHTDSKGEQDCLDAPHVMALVQPSYWSTESSQHKVLESQKAEIEKLKAENTLFKNDIEKIKTYLGIDAKSEK
jgi:hypothetical protein